MKSKAVDEDTISAKSPWNTDSINALNMIIINFWSTTKDDHPLPP